MKPFQKLWPIWRMHSVHMHEFKFGFGLYALDNFIGYRKEN